MSRKRVPWDGPNPAPGEYLATRQHGTVWLIRSVEPLRRPDVSGARLVLDVAILATAELPVRPKPVIHPVERAAPHEPNGPARVRQVYQGPASLMPASWRDPEDMRRTVRKAREIDGWRTFCPLRRMMRRNGSSITEKHIIAADHLRLLADTALIGFTGKDGMLPIGAVAYGPRAGPSAAAIAQATAAHDLARVLRRFAAPQQWLIVHVVMLNSTISAWCGADLNPQRELGKLIAALDELVEYYGTEIDRIIAAEQLVRAA